MKTIHPKTEMGRDALAKEHITTPTEPISKETIMTQNTFTPGQRVVHEATSTPGTLTSTNGTSAVVEWDAAGVAMPEAVLPVADLVPRPDIRDFSDADIKAELFRRRTSATSPAGFKLEYFCTCGCGCTPDDRMEEDCEIEGHSFEGPSTYLTNSTGCQVNTSWNPEDGISFRISCYDHNKLDEYVERAWTREEVEQLPEMVKQVLSKIDLAEAKAFFKRFPEPFEGTPTVNDLFRLAGDNNLKAPETLQAYMELTKGAGK